MDANLIQLAERVEAAGLTHVKWYVSENPYIAGKSASIATAAHCFTVAAALRAQAKAG